MLIGWFEWEGTGYDGDKSAPVGDGLCLGCPGREDEQKGGKGIREPVERGLAGTVRERRSEWAKVVNRGNSSLGL